MSRDQQVLTVLGWAILGLLGYLAYRVVGPFLAPLGWAAVFAIVAHPVYVRLERRWGRRLAALAGTLGMAVVVVVPAMLVTAVIADEAIDAAASVQRALADGRVSTIAQSWAATVQRLVGGSSIDLSQAAADVVRRTAELLVSRSGLALRDALLFGINVAIALFATYFLLRDSDAIMTIVRRLLPMPPSVKESAIARVHDLVSVGVSAAVIVATVQGLLGGVAFWILGLPAPAFWGVIMGVLCLFPMGAWVVWLPASVALAVNGDVGRGIALAVVGFVIVSGADNVLRPALVSGRAHINGLVILVGLLGGTAAFGALGLVIGPVVLATTLALLNAYVDGAAAPDGPETIASGTG